MGFLRGRRARHQEATDLDITAFMNLMVILVPFLLITAVFSRLAVLELNLPSANAPLAEESEPEFQLEITVRDARIEVGDRNGGLLKLLDNSDEGYDLAALADYLAQVKQQFPDTVNATLLLEQEVEYDTLVQVMDTVRVTARFDEAEGRVIQYELFPEISIGDAPRLN